VGDEDEKDTHVGETGRRYTRKRTCHRKRETDKTHKRHRKKMSQAESDRERTCVTLVSIIGLFCKRDLSFDRSF